MHRGVCVCVCVCVYMHVHVEVVCTEMCVCTHACALGEAVCTQVCVCGGSSSCNHKTSPCTSQAGAHAFSWIKSSPRSPVLGTRSLTCSLHLNASLEALPEVLIL